MEAKGNISFVGLYLKINISDFRLILLDHITYHQFNNPCFIDGCFLLRSFYTGGFFLLPFLWFINVVWFFKEAFIRPPFDQQKQMKSCEYRTDHREQLCDDVICPLNVRWLFHALVQSVQVKAGPPSPHLTLTQHKHYLHHFNGIV